MGMPMEKKGELTIETIVRLILIIAGIGIILAAMFLIFDFGNQSETEICRLSVLKRATVPESIQPYVPIKCKTQKICLNGGKECDEFLGIDKVQNIKVRGNNIKDNAKVIEKATADAMYDCWSMMGEGKLDLFGGYSGSRALSTKEPVCIICSRLAISGDISGEVLDETNVHDYIEKNQVPGKSISYLNAFTDRGVSSYPSIDEEIFENAWGDNKDDSLGIKADEGNREIAFVFSQIRPEGYSESFGKLAKDGLILSGGAFMVPGVGKFAGTILLKAVTTVPGLFVTGIVGAAGAGYAANNVYQGKVLAAGYCGSFTSTVEEGKSKGCSLVSAVPYSVDNINALCPGKIEGQP
jgi:hypothetical protein